MLQAVIRDVPASLARCQLTHIPRAPIDVGRARAQHRAYERALRDLGVRVHSLPALEDLPDSVFVEDTAVVLDDCALITRPGADSRKPETGPMAEVLRAWRPLLHIRPPGTLDGGDVLRIGRTLYVGLSGRSNAEAVAQMERVLNPRGYRIRGVVPRDCLHLKSAVTAVAEDLLLIQPAWVRREDFPGFRFVEVDPDEPFGANGLPVAGSFLYPSAFPKTRVRLEALGVRIAEVDVSELAKAEGAVTCCSLLFESP
jgi:dimethylargininase